MKPLSILIISGVLFFSCRKDKEIYYTSDVKYGYETWVRVTYLQDYNRTDIEIYYYYLKGTDPYNTLYPYKVHDYLTLPDNSYMLVNGLQMNHYSGYSYYLTLPGKPTYNFEFKDYDELMYYNTVIPTDTVYFVNLPDTIPHGEDLIVQIHATDLDSNAFNSFQIYEVESNFSYSDAPGGADSLVTIHKSYFDKGKQYQLILTRTRQLSVSNFPVGGGKIEFIYNVGKAVYVE